MRLRTNLPVVTKRLPRSGAIAYLGWAALLCVIEVLGRQSPNDLADSFLLSTFALGLLCGWLYDPWHILSNLTARFLKGLRRIFSGARIVFGIDFQCTAVLPAAFPVWWHRVVMGSATLTAGLLIASCLWSGDLRGWLAGGSYLLYLLVLGMLWIGLSTALLVNTFLAFAVIHDFLVEAYDGPGPRPLRGEIGLLGGGLAGALSGTMLLGPGIPMAAILIGATVWTWSFLLCPIGFSVQWSQTPGGPLRRFDGRWLWCQWGLLFLLTIDLIVLSCAGRVWQTGAFPSDSAMPVTLFLGDLLAWISSATVLALLAHRLRMVWLTLQLAPQRPPLPCLIVEGRLWRTERAGLRATFRQLGWSVRFGGSRAGDKSLTLAISADQLLAWRSRGQWFLDADLLRAACGPDRLQAGQRREEVQRRRQLLRGLERLFKRRKRSQRQAGTGYWIGLQHAFILGLARDESGKLDWGRETTILDEIIGMPFYAVIPPTARYHYRQMAEALQIDLIFVEDGVTFRRLVRVLRTMFEIYDVHGGRMPAREHHFSGLPGVRVILHEFDMNQAILHGRTGYPEPDYEEIGQACIMHVFRDRGEAAERVESPDAADWTPVAGGV